jgi:hypothetical protein
VELEQQHTSIDDEKAMSVAAAGAPATWHDSKEHSLNGKGFAVCVFLMFCMFAEHAVCCMIMFCCQLLCCVCDLARTH